VAWQRRQRASTRVVLLLNVTASTVYAVILVPNEAGIRPAVIGSVVVLAVLAALILAASLRRGHATVWSTSCGLMLAFAALRSSSAWATGSVIVSGEGHFDTPYQDARVTEITQVIPNRERAVSWAELARFVSAVPPSQAADVFETSYLASYDIFATGREFFPVGGYSGEVPTPSLRQFKRDVTSGKIVHATAAVAPRSHNPVMIWIITHCAKQTYGSASYSYEGTTMQRFTCSPSDVNGSAHRQQSR
jgi:hypothetical protein